MKRFLDILGRSIEALGQAEFYAELADGLSEAVQSDYVVFSHTKRTGPDEAPKVLFETASRVNGPGMKNWAHKGFAIYPSYKAIKSGFTLRTHSIAELHRRFGHIGEQPDPERHPITLLPDSDMGFRVDGLPMNIAVATCFLAAQSRNEIISLTLAREKTKSGIGFSDEELQNIDSIRPILNKTFLKHWDHTPPEGNMAFTPGSGKSTGIDTLTPKELEVLDLILAGLSTREICAVLNVAIPTIKSHRRNIYGKLGVTHVRELYAHFNGPGNAGGGASSP